MFFPPDSGIDISQLTPDDRARHEALVEAFGRMLFSLRNQCFERLVSLCSSEEERAKLGRIDCSNYEKVAQLEPEEREASIKLAKVAIDSFARLFLALLAQSGHEISCGHGHNIAFRLYMDLVNESSGQAAVSEVVNRDGRKSLPDYWGKWLNQVGSTQPCD
jgi:hypothetical protein